ncbi:MAG TPA: arsenic resistance N-acetyltransferase ArsN2 [Opitutaceae bacterium]|nr:arsenic resistance N-acetyltransferase ArsN2 [Opitutaceae bacterium]
MPTPSTPAISPATPADVPAIAALLRAGGLPHEDFAAHLAHFLVARDPGGAVIGAIGAEVRGSDALLRSLVVTSAARGTGLGSRLVAELECQAGGWGVARWWLLTTTAEMFFLKRGFHAAARTAAPAAIAATEEFRGLCPSAAICLTRERKGGA